MTTAAVPIRCFPSRARRALLFTGASLVLALAGCATYQPPDLPAHLLATISLDPSSHRLRFMSVDGVYLSSIGGLNAFVGRDELKLRPGKRALQVEYSEVAGLATQKGGVLLVFDAQAGKRYVVHELSEGRKFVAWLTTDNGAKVPLLKQE